MATLPPFVRSFFHLLLPYTWKSWKNKLASLVILLCLLVDVGLVLKVRDLFQEFIQWYYQPARKGFGWIAGKVILGWFLWKSIRPVRHIASFYILNQAIRDTRERVILHLHQIPLHTYDKAHIGHIQGAIHRISRSIRNFTNVWIEVLLPRFLKMFFLSLQIATLHAITPYFLPSMLTIVCLWSYWRIRRLLTSIDHAWHLSDDVLAMVQESLENTRIVRNRFLVEKKALKNAFDKEAKQWWRVHLQENLTDLELRFGFFLSSGILLFYVIYGLENTHLEVQHMKYLRLNLFWLYGHILNFVTGIKRFLRCIVDLKRVSILLHLPREKRLVQQKQAPKEARLDSTALHLDGVSFGYTGAKSMLLDKISLSIQRGDRVAIIGASGSGKTTLCHLLAGLSLPTSGKICIEGIDTQGANPSKLGHHVHFVPQRAPLVRRDLASSLFQHPTLHHYPIQRSWLIHASKKDTYHLPLSNGEKQQLLLIRCIASRPHIAILDEAFSDIDEHNAQALLRDILGKLSTVVLVTHRHSLIQAFDSIYKLQDGQLIAFQKKDPT